MDPLISCSGSQTIDIKLVKEQLRLLGHSVDETVILAFLEGLGATAYGGNDKSGMPNTKKLTIHCKQQQRKLICFSSVACESCASATTP